ncbi:MAG: hypothetical protein ACI9KE_004633, partial [Polyangiales bacterium]
MLIRRSFEALILVFSMACGTPATAPAAAPDCPPPEALECPEPPAAVDPVEAVEIQVVAGECALSAIPAGLIEETTAEQNEVVIALVRDWVNGKRNPWLSPSEGILFAKSEDDLGGDPPHPTWTQEQGTRACGHQTLWLRDRLLALLRLHADPEYGDPIQCSGNVCCYSDLGEYDSRGGVVFSQEGEGWRLRAGYEVAVNGTISGEHADELREGVNVQLQGLLA